LGFILQLAPIYQPALLKQSQSKFDITFILLVIQTIYVSEYYIHKINMSS
jgi:hypothetical protein